MKRILEPELMNTVVQAKAYANADFSEAHQAAVHEFTTRFPKIKPNLNVLDLGCGSADITIRFSKKYPTYTIDALDGSSAMLDQGRIAVKKAGLRNRITFHLSYLPKVPISEKLYDVVFSSSLLHHLHDPFVLWNVVKNISKQGTKIFIWDLFRPKSEKYAKTLVEEYAAAEPEILKRDFLNSFLASFTQNEIERQLEQSELNFLNVEKVSDRHLVVYGVFNR